ncbi:MAG TPA: phenylalanine--tRNA ligase subunit beta [Nevskiales bacterium]|nr:phenylalanine--tRNA ligase subunit beta [Nevskiales bacterium]
MKLSEAWLREWVDPQLDTAALAEQLTMAGLEVDMVEPAAPAFHDVVVARILSTDRHPNADRLRVCTVEAGQGAPLTIVCGAANARAGLCAPLALPGAELPGGLKISRSTVRGIESAGMLCSARELGLSEDAAGLLELPADAPVGHALRDYLQLDDAVLTLELTPNRGDCLSVMGLAREVAVLNRLPLTGPALAAIASTSDEIRQVRIDNAAACPRYAGRVVTGIDPRAVTPLWMRERLRRAGLRCIHPVVDITNYVLLELGQPMHAFDLARLQGGIVVRNAKPGESLTLLDGQTVALHASTLVIADVGGPVAMAGVMGGLPTAVSAETTDIFFESACFTPQAVAGQGRRYKLHTDSLHRFERGVDPALQLRALERATQLLLEIAGGQPGPVTDVCSPPEAASAIRLRHARLTRLLGASLDAAEVERILRALDMRVEAGAAGEWHVTPPSWRYDITLEADLIEEVARIHGYGRLPLRAQRVSLPAVSETESRLPESRLRECLIQRGYQEAVTYSFVEPQLQAQLDPSASAIDLDNPIAAPLAQMRTTLWSSLLPAWLYNVQRQQERVRLFELGMRFVRDPAAPHGIRQEPMLAGLVSGTARPEQWALPARAVDFYDLKADVEAVLAIGGRAAEFRIQAPLPGRQHPALHPGQCAQVVWRGDGRVIGWLGRLSPVLALSVRGLDIGAALPLVFELEAAPLREAHLPLARPIPEFPFVRRDLAIVIAEELAGQAVLDCIQTAGEALLRDVLIFDVYRGQGLQSGFKSVALGLIFQDYSRTLTDTEVDQSIARLQDRLNKVLGATVRG